jgi:uncharacterized membrane protein
MLLPIHIMAGMTALASGAVALYAAKGGWLHRKSGMIFVSAMLVLGATGAAMGALHMQRFNATQGVLTFYLVTTALLTVRRRIPEPRWIDTTAMLVALIVGFYQMSLGLEALNSPRGVIDGAPAAVIFIFGAVALLAASGDLRFLLTRGGLQGARRLARHLWRMCFAMFIATGSFFLGQAQFIPEPMRIPALLGIAALLPLALMLYWLARFRGRHDNLAPCRL